MFQPGEEGLGGARTILAGNLIQAVGMLAYLWADSLLAVGTLD